jgi:hypothetical protein
VDEVRVVDDRFEGSRAAPGFVVQAQQRQLGALGAAGIGRDHHRPLTRQVPAGARFAEVGELRPVAGRRDLIQLDGTGVVVADE